MKFKVVFHFVKTELDSRKLLVKQLLESQFCCKKLFGYFSGSVVAEDMYWVVAEDMWWVVAEDMWWVVAEDMWREQ